MGSDSLRVGEWVKAKATQEISFLLTHYANVAFKTKVFVYFPVNGFLMSLPFTL
jgi:hypothetical protein